MGSNILYSQVKSSQVKSLQVKSSRVKGACENETPVTFYYHLDREKTVLYCIVLYCTTTTKKRVPWTKMRTKYGCRARKKISPTPNLLFETDVNTKNKLKRLPALQTSTPPSRQARLRRQDEHKGYTLDYYYLYTIMVHHSTITSRHVLYCHCTGPRVTWGVRFVHRTFNN